MESTAIIVAARFVGSVGSYADFPGAGFPRYPPAPQATLAPSCRPVPRANRVSKWAYRQIAARNSLYRGIDERCRHMVFEDRSLGDRKKYLVNSCLSKIVSTSRPTFEHFHARRQPKARTCWLLYFPGRLATVAAIARMVKVAGAVGAG
jgi:hypothetical protein